MERRWLILADDLTGAADSAIAFARRRMPARLVWGDARPEDHSDSMVLAFDTATRERGPEDAARVHSEVLQRFLAPGMRVFKKIDSTLRGHPAEEIAAMLDVLLTREPATRVVLAPSFPAMGRTVRAGESYVHGIPLPLTEYWPDGRQPRLGNLVNLLESAGIASSCVPLATLRGEPSRLRDALFPPALTNFPVAVCDAETMEDLDRIAAAAFGEEPTLFIGSGGLAHALAQLASREGAPRRTPDRCEGSAHGALLVVGSRSQASRDARDRLAAMAGVRSVSIDPAMLRGDQVSAAHAALAQSIGDALAAGDDVVVDIAPSDSSSAFGDPQLVSALARLLAPATRAASALVATGGETAAALLARVGGRGIRLLDEIEPGIALGLTLGKITIPVVTKAGGFGNQDCLMRVLARLRFIRQTGTVA